MGDVSSAAMGCLPTADAAFGPVVQSCRDDFDFTVAFEQYFFTILPAALLLLAAPFRLKHLSGLPAAFSGQKLLRSLKLVSLTEKF